MQKIIKEIVKTLAEKYRPDKVILFGSYAYGKPTEHSDIDLLIIKDTDKRRVDRFVEIQSIVYEKHCEIPISPLVLTQKELQKRINMGDDFIREIVEKGKVLYEK